MKRWLPLLVLLAGCQTTGVPSSSPSASPLVLGEGVSQDGQPRLIPLRLTLSNPEDLKVSQGDEIRKGQVLSDRNRERQRIQVQLEKLRANLKQLDAVTLANFPARSIPPLPPMTFLEQQRAIEVQTAVVASMDAEIQTQQVKMEQLSSLPDLPEMVTEHEQGILKKLQDKRAQAIAALNFTRSQLATAQQDRRYQEYQHLQAVRFNQLEVDKQRLELAKQQQTLAFNRAQILAEIGRLEGEMVILSAVRSPFSGKVQRIQWVGQNDQTLTVELTVRVDVESASAGRTPSLSGQ